MADDRSYGEHPRRTIRTALKSCMKVNRLSAARVAKDITEQADEYGTKVTRSDVTRFLNIEAGRVRDTAVSAFEKYVAQHSSRPVPQPSGTRESGQHHRLFPAVLSFFDVHPSKADQFRDAVLGTYTFYAWSEKDMDQICKGAIQLYVDRRGEFSVRELQASVPEGGQRLYREQYNGHFFFREKDMIVILRAKEGLIPKFYIMSVLRWRDSIERYALMEGAILKIGEQKSVFMHNICMFRNDDAFNECAMLHPHEVPPNVLRFLDSRKWSLP